jgi:hypothetical protein
VNIKEMQSVVELISFEDYRFEVRERNGVAYLQASYTEPDIITHAPTVQQTRKWMLSEHAVKSEIVQTAFKCVNTSMEHRAREGFLYRGERVYGPHFDVEALYEAAQERRLDYRGRKSAAA